MDNDDEVTLGLILGNLTKRQDKLHNSMVDTVQVVKNINQQNILLKENQKVQWENLNNLKTLLYQEIDFSRTLEWEMKYQQLQLQLSNFILSIQMQVDKVHNAIQFLKAGVVDPFFFDSTDLFSSLTFNKTNYFVNAKDIQTVLSNSKLTAISDYKENSPKRLSIQSKHVDKRVPRPADTRWTTKSQLVANFHENIDDITNAFKELSELNDANSAIDADTILSYLVDKLFIFWLKFFAKIMPQAEILFDQMQHRQEDVKSIKHDILSFEKIVTATKNVQLDNETASLRTEANEVCDLILEDMGVRFSFNGHLKAALILENDSNIELIPEDVFKSVCQHYSLDPIKLTELSILKERPVMAKIDKLIRLWSYIIKNNMENSFKNILRLVNILITLPMTTSEAERCFSTLKRIKTYLRNNMGEERLNGLAAISVSKQFFKDNQVIERVINKFVSMKKRRIEFIYQQ